MTTAVSRRLIVCVRAHPLGSELKAILRQQMFNAVR